MNKNDYIREVDKIVPSDELKNKIKNLETKPVVKKNYVWKTVVAIAACFVVVIALSAVPAFFGANSEDKSSMNLTVEQGAAEDIADGTASNDFFSSYSNSSGTSSGATGGSSASATVTSDRKIIKNAEIYVDTKNYSVFMTALNQKIGQLDAYIEESNEFNSGSETANRNSNMKVRVPAENLDTFIKEIESLGTVTSKSVNSSDITDSYIDTQSRLNALKTEEETLLGLLKDADNLSDVIEIQSRISQVRADIESMETTLKRYDSQVEYSNVWVYVNEVEREVESDGSFFGRVKETFLENVYGLGEFFEDAAVSVLGGIPYILIAAVVAVAVILIIKKVKKR